MNLGSMRKTKVNTAKEQLALHKNLGQRSALSILQVAELLDIVSGKDESPEYSAIFFDNPFSLN